MNPVVGKIPVETEEGKVGETNELPVGAGAEVVLFSVGAAPAALALDPSEEEPAATKPEV